MEKSTLRVLIVSLPGFIQRMLTHTFKAKPAVDLVDIASGGLSAIHSVETHQPDVVVIDSSLPYGERDELIKEMRERHPRIYCLVLSETTSQLHHLRQAGADLAMRAPDLVSKIDDLLVDLSTRAWRSST